MNPTNILSEEQFCHELINRFFHPDSFFFHCVNHEIESLLEQGIETNDDYLLLGSLMDRLVNTDDKVQELELLSNVNGFSRFYKKLLDGVKFLREADLDSERMKIEIESLAQSIIAAAIQSFKNTATKSELKKVLGISSPEPEPTPEPEQRVEIIEPSFEGPGISEPDFSPDSQDDFPQLIEEEKDILPSSNDTEVVKVGGFEIGLSDEGGSNIFEENSGDSPEALNAEPGSIVPTFQTEIKNRLGDLTQCLSLLKADVRNMGHWQECDEVFDSIVSSSMVYGFDAFEQIADKARALILRGVRKSNDFELVLLAITEAKNVLSDLLANPEKVETEVVKTISQKLRSPQKKLFQKESLPSKKVIKKNEVEDVSNFKLPGEDDEDLLNLVREVTADSMVTQVATPADSLANFKQQTGIYFNVIDEALRILEVNPTDVKSFEDIQLSANSLHDLALKMNLEPLAEFPKLAQNIAQSVVSQSYMLSEADHQILMESYQHYRKITKIEDTGKSEVKNVMMLLADLSSRIGTFALLDQEVTLELDDITERGLNSLDFFRE